MKNKNILAENMLRFRSKNLSETTKRKIVRMAEIILEQGVSPEDAEQGKKMDWNFGYRPGDVIQNIFPGFPASPRYPEIVDFEFVSANLYSKPANTPGNKPKVFGRVKLKHMKNNQVSEFEVYGGKPPILRYLGRDVLLKQSVALFNSNEFNPSEFLRKLKADYLKQVS